LDLSSSQGGRHLSIGPYHGPFTDHSGYHSLMHDDLAQRLRNLLEAGNLSQAKLAQIVGVSQPTVSRALSGRPARRRGQARERLFIYASTEADTDVLGGDRAAGRSIVLTAFDQIWDGSPAHAEAVARVVTALRGLTAAQGHGR
jgi:transcriptional regulator with XRE-family HTH domain